MTFFKRRYQQIEKLGQGGMGVVWRAYDRLLGRDVALKQVHAQAALALDGLDARAQLSQEFHLLASLRHPHIVGVLDYGWVDELPYYTMELLLGAPSLGQAMQQATQAEVLGWVNQVLQALAYLHRRGILHRDLKPSNVLIHQGTARLLDFGLASPEGQAHGVAGTLAYMAPELLRGEAASTASDLYALGVILYEWLTGQHPYAVEDTTRLVEQILDASPDLGPLESAGELGMLVAHLLTKDPAERPHDAWDVLAALSAATGQGDTSEPLLSREAFLQAARFVGRDAELEALHGALHQAQQGRGSAWLVEGESGAGKSRLLDELSALALIQGCLVVRGQQSAEGLPYALWHEPLRALALASSPEPFEAALLRVVVPDIGALLDVELPEVPALDENARRQRLFSALVRLLRAQAQPTLILLEDAHWDRGEGLALLARLIPLLADLPLLVVASARSDERPDLAQDLPNIQRLPLARLDARAIAELSASMLGAGGQQPEVIELLRRETEGNAFFIVEVVRALAEESGGLAMIGQVTLPQQVFTGGVRRVIQRRLDKVPPEARPWLQWAAVAGRWLDFNLLEAREDWLMACAEAGVLDVNEDRWRFAHDKLREQLLADLSAEERAAYHGQVAQAIERAYPDQPERSVLLADHWQQANDAEREAFHALRGGQYLLSLGQFQAALGLLERALKRSQDPIQRADIFAGIGLATLRLSEYQRASQAYRDSLAWSEQENDARRMSRAILGLSEVAKWRDDFRSLARLQARGLALARTVDDRAAVAQHIANGGIIARAQGDHEAEIQQQQEALALFRALDDLSGMAHCLDNLGIAHRALARYEAASAYQWQALQLCERAGDRWGVARALNGLGYIARLRNELDEAERIYQDSVALFSETGDRWGIASGTNGLGYVAWLGGRWEEAEQRFHSSRAICQAIGDQWGIAICELGLGHVARDSGRYEVAEHQLVLALRQALSIPVLVVALEAALGFARLLAELGNLDSAALLAGCVLAQSATTDDVRQVAAPLLARLDGLEHQARLREGAALPFNDLANEILGTP